MKLRTLYDVNVLLALIDNGHPHNAAAQDWHARNAKNGWASTPTTQNGFVRIISRPAYDRSLSIGDAMNVFRQVCEGSDHEFWPEDLSLFDETYFDATKLRGHSQITDCYLLAVAIRRGGRLATFDRRVPTQSVRRYSPEHYVVLG